MRTTTEVLIHPYQADAGKSVLHVLISEFTSPAWTAFRGAVHFVKASGHYTELLSAMQTFLDRGGNVALTFGADVFGRDDPASERAAIDELLDAFDRYENFRLYLYHEPGRTFHPKVYLFSNVEEQRATLIVGSSNWSEGGFVNNVEVSIRVDLDLTLSDHSQCYADVVGCMEEYWQESE